MKFSSHHILPVLLLFSYSCSTAKNTSDTLPGTALQAYGRFAVNEQKGIELISSAAHVGFSFTGKDCWFVATVGSTNEHGYLQYELDGVYQKRIRVEGSNHQPVSINAKNDGKHTVWIYKTTEAHSGPVFIEKIIGNQLQTLKEPNAPLIEFIGNSITCGAAADPSEMPCGTGQYHDQHNAYYAYGPRVARSLGVNYMLSSVSGIGIYRNWNSNGPTMPQVYEKTDFQQGSNRSWDFKTFHPAIVSIALGTNDYSDGDGTTPRLPFDSTAFTGNYVKFVQLIKTKYPDAQIALLSSPMISGERRQILQDCLTNVKKSIDALYPSAKPVAVYFFNPMQAKGCGGHPSVADHALLAKELEPFFKKLLN